MALPQPNHDRQLIYHYGNSRYAKRWQRIEASWSSLAKQLMIERRTNETMEEYAKKSKDDKQAIKDVGGFVGAILKDGVRSPSHVQRRTLLTLDADFAHGGLWDTWMILYGYAAVMYQTHSWTPEKPKYRIVAPLSRDVTCEEYDCLSYHVAYDLGADQFDRSTHQVNRLMFFPSICADAPFESYLSDGPIFDVDDWFACHPDWQDRSTWPVVDAWEDQLKKERGKLLDDPRNKHGLIGAFCKAYDIASVIDMYLSEQYLPGSEDRYTWSKGTTANGLVVYDNGMHAYSNHSTDPVYGKCVNAFDLVRIHLYGALDEGSVAKGCNMPSMKAMQELIRDDVLVQEVLSHDWENAFDDYVGEGKADPRRLFFRIDVDSRSYVFCAQYAAEWYQRLQPVATMNGELYRYDSGRYVRAEGHFLKAFSKALGEEYTTHRVKEVLTLLVHTSPEIKDPFGPYLNFQNGLLDLESGELMPHTSEILSTVQLPHPYVEDAKCPTIDAFFADFAGDPELVWNAIGMTLVDSMHLETGVILLGPGGNGKGTTLELINRMLGVENVSAVSLQSLEENRFAAAGLVGKLANIQADLPTGVLEANGVYKQLVSGDLLSAERKGKDAFTFNSRAKLIFSANEPPKSKDNTYGFYRKWCVIKFDKRFDDKERRDKLFEEIEGMLSKAVRYAMQLRKMKAFPGQGAIDEFRMANDSAYAFLVECCEEDTTSVIQKGVLYQEYQTYCSTHGVFAVSDKKLCQKVKEVFPKVTEPRSGRERKWGGLKVLTDSLI